MSHDGPPFVPQTEKNVGCRRNYFGENGGHPTWDVFPVHEVSAVRGVTRRYSLSGLCYVEKNVNSHHVIPLLVKFLLNPM